ncbi:MAG: C40 family peptidase [Propionibacteriaceae bacterium]|jgi:cell wall-associated NlpC family hydrolase|nr:C40 family peptidase [Propionibacteriaceae bacterium]
MRVGRVVASLGAVVLAVAWAAAPPAQADPQTVAQAQAEVDTLAREASELGQQYDDVRLRLEAAQADVARIRDDIVAQENAIGALKDQVAQIALREWQSYGMGSAVVLFASEDSNALLSQLAATRRAAQASDDLLQTYRLGRADLGDKRQRLEKLAADIQADNDRLAALTAEADTKLTAAKAALSRLRAADARAAAARASVTRQAAVRDDIARSLVSDGTQGAIVANFAISKVGGPYVWGGNGPSGYDCSGLTRAAYLAVGISLPHSSSAQFGYGVPVSLSELRPGDLVFYYSGISHVGVYVGDGMIVHASTYGVGIVYSPVSNAPVAGARRLV